MIDDSGQHVSQVRFRIDTIELGGSDQAAHRSGTFPAKVRAAKQKRSCDQVVCTCALPKRTSRFPELVLTSTSLRLIAAASLCTKEQRRAESTLRDFDSFRQKHVLKKPRWRRDEATLAWLRRAVLRRSCSSPFLEIVLLSAEPQIRLRLARQHKERQKWPAPRGLS